MSFANLGFASYGIIICRLKWTRDTIYVQQGIGSFFQSFRNKYGILTDLNSNVDFKIPHVNAMDNKLNFIVNVGN